MDRYWTKMYDNGVPADIEIPNIPLYRILENAVKKTPDNNFISYFGKKFTFKQFSELVDRFAAGLISLHIHKGDRVIIALPNIPQFLIAYWALIKMGVIVVLVNPFLSERELVFQIKNSGAQTVIVYEKLYSRLFKSIDDLAIKNLIIARVETFMPLFLNMAFQIQKQFQDQPGIAQKRVNTVNFQKLIGEDKLEETLELDSSDPAVMIYTGGITGVPKAAVLTHKNLVANAMQAHTWINDYQDGKEVIMAVLPLIHSYGMTACNHLPVLSSSMIILSPRFKTEKVLNDIYKYNITIFPGVPTMFTAIVNEAKNREVNLASIRVCITGAAPLSLHLKTEFEKLTKGRIVEGYGLTEASPITHCNPIGGISKLSSIGVPWPGTEARIVDLQTGIPLKEGQTGELQVRGPQIMAGYWQQKEETDRVIDKDGWLNTGDLGKFDADGYFFIVDRRKDIIFYGGESIYPAEIEKVINELPDVEECAVTGVDDEYYGQLVKAYIVLKENCQLTKDDILEHCSAQLAKFKVPRVVQFVDHLPKNFLGKVLKRNLV